MKNYPHIFFYLCFILLLNYSYNKVSEQNLRQFFKLTYDQNNDQIITWKEFYKYFRMMEPEHQLTFDSLNSAFNAFDQDKNGIIHIKEFINFPDVIQNIHQGHRQIHLGFTQNQGQMQVMWVSSFVNYQEPFVQFGIYQTKLDQCQNATQKTYNVGHLGFHGQIFRAVMKNLKFGQKYYYRVGDRRTKTFSELKYFKAPPKRNQTLEQIRMAVFGDMGTYVPFGHMVTKLLASKNSAKPYDYVFLTGDIAYAGISHQSVGQLEPVWDLFGQQTQSFASYTAFMPGVGNHQSYYNYTSYFYRYVLPRNHQNQTNLYFSFDYGQVHMVHISSEHPYDKNSEQYNFLQQDLKKARANPHIKWIILGTHRTFYCSDQCQYAPISPLTHHLQDLVNKYKVDIVQTGHLHVYQRSWPVYNGKPFKQNHNQNYYINPETPIYVVQGTAGALISKKDKWVQPKPQWSLKRIKNYGYGQITVKANYLKYEFISLPIGKVVDTWYIVKDANGKNVIKQQLLKEQKQI